MEGDCGRQHSSHNSIPVTPLQIITTITLSRWQLGPLTLAGTIWDYRVYRDERKLCQRVSSDETLFWFEVWERNALMILPVSCFVMPLSPNEQILYKLFQLSQNTFCHTATGFAVLGGGSCSFSIEQQLNLGSYFEMINTCHIWSHKHFTTCQCWYLKSNKAPQLSLGWSEPRVRGII